MSGGHRDNAREALEALDRSGYYYSWKYDEDLGGPVSCLDCVHCDERAGDTVETRCEKWSEIRSAWLGGENGDKWEDMRDENVEALLAANRPCCHDDLQEAGPSAPANGWFYPTKECAREIVETIEAYERDRRIWDNEDA